MGEIQSQVSKQSKKQVKRNPALKIFFDTNVLYTQIASDLLKKETSDLIFANSLHVDLTISWYLPDIVVKEREYQMCTRAKDLLPQVEKMERLLGHKLGISEEIAIGRVKSAIQFQLESHKLVVAQVAYEKVDWPRLVAASASRTPPFQQGETEKGFRDAMALEAFVQEWEVSPRTPAVCRLVFVSGDELMREALRARLPEESNVRILSGLDELRGLINTLASEVSEEYIADVAKKAELLFYTAGVSQVGLYWAASSTIASSFASTLESKPQGIDKVEKVQPNLTSPQFVKKVGSALYWLSTITINQKLLRTKQASATPTASLTALPNASAAVSTPMNLAIANLLTKYASPAKPEFEEVATRATKFSVSWQTRVNSHRKLSAAKIDEISLAE